MNNKTERDKKALIKKYENPQIRRPKPSDLKELYLKQTDRNYKDGDRN